jgi:helicase
VRALLIEGYNDRKCLEELSEEELAKVVPKRLAGRIKERFSGEDCKVKDKDLDNDSPTEGTENTEGRHNVCPYVVQDDRHGLTTILEIDRHRPDRIIFEGKEVKVTAIGFSLIYLLAQHRGKILTHNDLLDTIWKESEDASYIQITYHLYKIRRDILKTIGNNKKNKEKVKDILKVISRRGIMLNLAEEKLKIN